MMGWESMPLPEYQLPDLLHPVVTICIIIVPTTPVAVIQAFSQRVPQSGFESYLALHRPHLVFLLV